LESNLYPGFTFYSQNILSTVIASVGYYYTEHTQFVAPSIKLEGFYPVIEIRALFSSEPEILYIKSGVTLPETKQTFYSIILDAYLPLDFTRNKYSRFFRPEISFRYLNRYFYSEDEVKL
jgi:hypothetical protein